MPHHSQNQSATTSGTLITGAGHGLSRQGRFILFLVLFSIFSYYLVSRYLITAVIVQGRSMAPTIQDGDHYLLNRFALWFREPRRGDLVVIRDVPHSECAVKRVVALPGEAIEVKYGQVYIDGKPLAEPYLMAGERTRSPSMGNLSVTMGPKQYFVMGDNRAQSEDSRSYGPLLRQQIVGLLVK